MHDAGERPLVGRLGDRCVEGSCMLLGLGAQVMKANIFRS